MKGVDVFTPRFVVLAVQCSGTLRNVTQLRPCDHTLPFSPFLFNPLEPSGYYMYHQPYHTEIQNSSHGVYWRVQYCCHSKQ
jgi:hypothetical protein